MNARNVFNVVLNSISFFIMLAANYAGNIGLFSDNNVADVSHKYDTLFAPAGYAFIIWGFLFTLSFCFIIFQWTLVKNRDPARYISATGIWFTVSNVCNAAWVYCWTNEMMILSVFIILALLSCLIILAIRLRLELDDAPVRVIFFVWWPIAFYLGWIMVATIACAAAGLNSLQLPSYGFSESIWAAILLLIACALYLILIVKRNMREAALVGAWAFVAIAIRQWHGNGNVAMCALIAAIILLAASAVHAYKNRSYNIIAKLKRDEW